MGRRSGKHPPEMSVTGAVEILHRTLLPFANDDRDRILSAVAALLDMAEPQRGNAVRMPAEGRSHSEQFTQRVDRPLSLREVLDNAKPATNPQTIAVFAYYRERIEGLSRFSRGELKDYFARARLKPPANYDRDFSEAVRKGLIHESGADSYLTSKGLEAVEGGFAGKRLGGPRKMKGRKKKSPRARTQQKK